MKTTFTIAAACLLAGATTVSAEDFMPFGGDDNNTNWYNDGYGSGYGDGSGRGRGSGEFNMNFSGKADADMETRQTRNLSARSDGRFYNDNTPYGNTPYGWGGNPYYGYRPYGWGGNPYYGYGPYGYQPQPAPAVPPAPPAQ